MPPELPKNDLIRLLHMRDAACQALAFARGRTRDDMESDAMLRRAITHCIQEIGEAACRVPPEVRIHIPTLPWNQIVGMRHRLVHAYFDINIDLVWDVVTNHLPQLVALLVPLLGEEGTDPRS